MTSLKEEEVQRGGEAGCDGDLAGERIRSELRTAKTIAKFPVAGQLERGNRRKGDFARTLRDI